MSELNSKSNDTSSFSEGKKKSSAGSVVMDPLSEK